MLQFVLCVSGDAATTDCANVLVFFCRCWSNFFDQQRRNPTTGAINLTIDVAGKVVICNIDGKQLQQYEAKAGITSIALPTGMASGVYMLRFTRADGSSKMARLVYQQ